MSRGDGRRAAIEALIVRNAEACENARHPKCNCACGGKMHGQAHGQAWVSQQADLAMRSSRRPEQMKLLSDEL
jgi:hypothetical protein